jgi:hypothetical protein
MPWFERADGVRFCVLDQYDDTLERLRSEGWKELHDPDAAPARGPEIGSAVPPAPALTHRGQEEPALALPETTPTPVVPARPAIRATAKVGGRKRGTGTLSPQMRAKQLKPDWNTPPKETD